MSEASTKAKCFRDSDHITAEAQRTFGDHITARLQLVPEIDSRAKMPIARPQTRTPRRPVNTMNGDAHDAPPKDTQENLGAPLNPDRWGVESDSLGEVERSLFTSPARGVSFDQRVQTRTLERPQKKDSAIQLKRADRRHRGREEPGLPPPRGDSRYLPGGYGGPQMRMRLRA
jgi:hypothetical protein